MKDGIMTMSKWEIRKDGKPYASSSIPNLGYSPSEIEQMRVKKYFLFQDGKQITKETKRRGAG